MRFYRQLPLVLIGLGSVACTALLGDFDVSSSGGTDGGGGDDGGGGGEGGGGEGGGGEAGAFTVTPGDSKLGVLRPLKFSATGAVTWSVQEGASGGAIDQNGNYRSPSMPGIYHVVATSKSDSTLTQSVALTVVALGVTLAGGAIGGAGNIDGPPLKAHLRGPQGLGYLGSSGSVLVIADTGNNTIRKYDAQASMVTTLAGTPGVRGTTDGTGPAAKFYFPTDIAVDENGSKVWINDSGNNCIRRVDLTSGAVTTFAGTCGTAGHTDGATGATSVLGNINAMVLGPKKDALYICEIEGGSSLFRGIRRIDATTGRTTSIISGLNNGCKMASDYFNNYVYYNDNNNALAILRFADVLGGPPVNPTITTLVTPVPEHQLGGLAVATGYGNEDDVYVPSDLNPIIYHYRLGTAAFDVAPFTGVTGMEGDVDGTLATARYGSFGALIGYSPQGVLYAADYRANSVRKIEPDNDKVTTYAGAASSFAQVDGARNIARLLGPFALSADGSGNIFVADVGLNGALSNTIRKVDSTGAISTLAGVPYKPSASDLPVDGTATQAKFGVPEDMVAVGPTLYVVDYFGNAIRAVTIATGRTTTFAGELNISGSSNGPGAAAHFKFNDPTNPVNVSGGAITTDGTNLYVADSGNFAVRKIVIATGVTSTLAGGTQGTANGTGAAAQFMNINGITYDNGFVYVADALDNTIRRVETATGKVTSYIGLSATIGHVDGDATMATFTNPFHILADGIGNLYVTEAPTSLGSGIIRRIDMSGPRASVFAGTAGKLGLAPGPLPSTFNCPTGLALTPTGDLLVGDPCDSSVVVIQAL